MVFCRGNHYHYHLGGLEPVSWSRLFSSTVLKKVLLQQKQLQLLFFGHLVHLHQGWATNRTGSFFQASVVPDVECCPEQVPLPILLVPQWFLYFWVYYWLSRFTSQVKNLVLIMWNQPFLKIMVPHIKRALASAIFFPVRLSLLNIASLILTLKWSSDCHWILRNQISIFKLVVITESKLWQPISLSGE